MNFTYNSKRGDYIGFCRIKSCEKKTAKSGSAYLDMTLADKTGEISAKLWSYNEDIHGVYEVNDLIKVKGTITKYRDADQFKVEQIRPVLPEDNITIDDCVPSSDYSGEMMFAELIRIAEGFSDEEIKKLVTAILEENKEKLVFYPAASSLHHAMRGGLLQHTLSIVRLAQNVVKIYPFVDGDLLIGGAILHDISKIDEYVADETGLASGRTVEGNLLGHLVMGAMRIEKKAEELGITRQKAVLLEHMLISHHGDPEFGAAVRPLFLEADILAALDRLDARIIEIHDLVKSIGKGSYSTKFWALDNRSFYQHGRVDPNASTNLALSDNNGSDEV